MNEKKATLKNEAAPNVSPSKRSQAGCAARAAATARSTSPASESGTVAMNSRVLGLWTCSVRVVEGLTHSPSM